MNKNCIDIRSNGGTLLKIRASHRRKATLLMWTAIPVAAALMTCQAQGATLTWDASGTHPAGPTDGVGNWDTTTVHWSNGTADSGWNNSGSLTAVFGSANGAAGTVTIDGSSTNMNVSGITFNAAGSGNYNVTSGTNTLTLLGTTPTITVATGLTPILSAIVTGSSGLTFAGAGTGALNLDGANTYSGITNISSGVILLTTTAGFGTSTVYVPTTGEVSMNAGLTITNSFNISGNGVSTASIPAALVLHGTLSNASGGTLNIFGTGARIGGPGNGVTISEPITSTGTGNLEFYSKASGAQVFTLQNPGDSWAGTTTITNSSGTAGITTDLKMGASSVYPGGPLILNATSAGIAEIDVAGRTIGVNGLSNTGIAANDQVINSAGGAGTINLNQSGSASFSGVITNTGITNITMSGTGMQTLSGTSNYSGVTSVNAGTFSVTGSLLSTGIVNVSAGTLAGTGSVGIVTLNNASGAINPGATGTGSIGTLTMASLNASNGSLQYDLSSPGSSDFMSISGNANLSGGTTINLASHGAGTFTLLTAGAIGGALPTLTGSSPAGSRPATFQYDPSSWNPTTNSTATSIVVDVSGSTNLVWAGNVAGFTANGADGTTWDNLQGTGAGGSNDQNWNNNGTQDYFYNSDSVTFNDTGTPNYTINLTTSVVPGAVVFNNSTGNYVISGAGSINGVANLTMNGTASVTLAVAGSNYSGGTTINNGILNANASSALGTGLITLNSPGQLNINNAAFGSGSITINGGTIDNTSGSPISLTTNNTQTWVGNFNFAGSSNLNLGSGSVTLTTSPTVTVTQNTLTVAGNISGNNGLTKMGAGTLVLSGANSYTGTTTISAGTVYVTNSNALGSLSGSGVVINGGTLDIGGVPLSNSFIPLGLPFTIAGTGANGIGAVTNSDATTNGPQFNTFRGNNVTLSANALISGNRIDIGRAAASTLNLNGFTLTLNMNGSSPMFGMEGDTTVTSGYIVVEAGTLDMELNAAVLADSSGSNITLDNGANVQFYNTATPTMSVGVTRPMIVLGNNVIGSANTAVATVGSNLTLEGNVTLEAINTGIPSLTSNFPLLLTGNINQAGGSFSVTKTGVSTVTLSGSNSYTGGTVITQGLLVAASGLAAVGSGPITVNGGGAIFSNTSAGTIFAMLHGGYNNGAWNGSTGINSSTAASDSAYLHAVGMLQPAVATTFEGQPLGTGDVAVKYTYYGDANLDGKVDGSDYSLIDNGYLNSLTGWQNGDFNYDGVIDGSDYALIDNAFNTQGAQIAAEIATPTAEVAGLGGAGASSAVPEPASLGLLGIAAAGLLGRRRRGR